MRKKRIVSAVWILLMLFTFGFSAANTVSEIAPDVCGISVCAAEADNTDAVIDDSAENQTSDTASGEAQNDESSVAQKKSGSAFFKWAVPITCILSLVLAVFLAIRKANKKFGDGWE